MHRIPTEKIIDIIKEAGDIILSAHNIEEDDGNIHVKVGSANFVTVFDVKVQEFLIERLSAVIPSATFMAEEKDNDSAVPQGYSFCIDPIDGTTNFIHDYKTSSISVALLFDGEVIFGAVYDPYRDELFSAEKGKGAYLGGERIRVSEHRLCEALVGIGSSPYYKDTLSDKTFEIAKKCFLNCVDIRRSGSAALDLCYVASGRIDVFFECILSPWDYAAGSLIIAEAGGHATQFDGSPLTMNRPCSLLSSNHQAYEGMKELVK